MRGQIRLLSVIPFCISTTSKSGILRLATKHILLTPSSKPVIKVKDMKTEAAINFNRGYMCALACIVKGHGNSSIIEEAFSCNSMTVRQMRASGVDESDIEALRPCVKEVERKQKLFNAAK